MKNKMITTRNYEDHLLIKINKKRMADLMTDIIIQLICFITVASVIALIIAVGSMIETFTISKTAVIVCIASLIWLGIIAIGYKILSIIVKM